MTTAAATTITPTIRRVLADKPTNAYLQLQGLDGAGDGDKSHSKNLVSPQRVDVMKAKASVQSGQKRKREEEVYTGERTHPRKEDEQHETPIEFNDVGRPTPEGHFVVPPADAESSPLLSQSTNLLSETSSASVSDRDEVRPESSSAPHNSTTSFSKSAASAGLSWSQRSEELHEAAMEEQFEMPEEMSQQSLEKIHAVKLSHSQQPASQLIPALHPSSSMELSQESFGMSSFIDYEKEEAMRESSDSVEPTKFAEGSEGLKMAPSSPPSEDRKLSGTSGPRKDAANDDGVLANDADRPELLEALRTRLQLALFKVETNQTRTPFSRLLVPKSKSSPRQTSQRSGSPELPDLVPPKQLQRSFDGRMASKSFSSMTNQMNSPESKLAAARARINNLKKPRVKSLDSLPVPELRPGAYSARPIKESLDQEIADRTTDNDKSDEDRVMDEVGPEASSSRSALLGLRGGDGSAHEGDQQMIDPELGRYDDEPPVTPLRNTGFGSSGASLNSSVVKGEAANGLLNLMRGDGA